MAYDDLSAAMPDRTNTGRRAVTAFFDTADAADMAQVDLIQGGVPAADIRVAGGEATEAEPAHPHGFWASLKEFFLPEEDRHLYAEGLRRGGFAVSVETDGGAYDRVLEILDRDGAVGHGRARSGLARRGLERYAGLVHLRRRARRRARPDACRKRHGRLRSQYGRPTVVRRADRHLRHRTGSDYACGPGRRTAGRCDHPRTGLRGRPSRFDLAVSRAGRQSRGAATRTANERDRGDAGLDGTGSRPLSRGARASGPYTSNPSSGT